MQRFLEFIFGLKREPTDPGVERMVDFNPPAWMFGQHRLVNTLLVLAALALVILIYRREGRRTAARVGLGALRMLVFIYVIMLINRPVLKVTEIQHEPSVLAILVDDSISMMVRDLNPDGTPTDRAGVSISPSAALAAGPATQPGGGPATRPRDTADGPTRLDVVASLLTGEDQALLRRLAKTHHIRLYRFSKDAQAIGTISGPAGDPKLTREKDGQVPLPPPDPKAGEALASLKAEGNGTQVVPSLLTVLDDLQGQRIAGVVVLTDARETPVPAPPAAMERLRKYNARIYPVAVGSDKAPLNIRLTALSMQDSVFKDDIVTVKVQAQGTGYEAGHPVRITLTNEKTGQPLKDADGRPVEQIVNLPDANPAEVELIFKPDELGMLKVKAEADWQPGELFDKDNARTAQVAVLDAKINVLYVDGYPRWEYRYIKNEMIRDRSVNISCYLTSADQYFAQEGDPPEPPAGPNAGNIFPGPITRFPETMEEIMKYDVVLFGDVDPRQFTDRQLQLVSDFVSKKGGGFGMIAGPWHAPVKYRNTPMEAILPVNISMVQAEGMESEPIRDGWRPVITDEGKRGEGSTIFRFFADKALNEKFIREDLQPLFWYLRGATVKPGVGLVYAEHPMDSDPSGRKASLLVLGRFGAGRTLFSAIDDSWRWRYYTGESVFDTYWVQQLRYLARSRKLGQRGIQFVADRFSYEHGERVKLDLKVLDPVLLEQLPPQVRVDVVDENGQPVRQVTLVRQETPNDLYTVSFTPDKVGKFTAKLPSLSQAVAAQELPFEISIPRLELSKPEVDRTLLSRLAPPEQVVTLADAKAKLPEMIKSAARNNHVPTTFPLWNQWRALWIFVLLITAEWVLRKVFGML